MARSPRIGFQELTRKRRKSSPIDAALSMLTTYRERATKSLNARRKAIRKAANTRMSEAAPALISARWKARELVREVSDRALLG